MAGRARSGTSPYAGVDDLVRHRGELTTIRALYRDGLVRLSEVKNFRERKGRVGTRWFADVVADRREDGGCVVNSGWMIRRADYVDLRDNVEPLRHVGPIGVRARVSPLAERSSCHAERRAA